MQSMLNRIRMKHLIRLHQDESGAAYSLSVMLILPFYLAYITFSIELMLLMNSNAALTTAMQTASHTARAWIAHRDALEHENRSFEDVVRDSMSRTMFPITTTKAQSASASDEQLRSILIECGLSSAASTRFVAKEAFIQNSLRVTVGPRFRKTDGILIEAEYDSPLWIPFFEPLLATGRNFSGPVRTLRAQVWIPMQQADIGRTHVNIPYSPALAVNWPQTTLAITDPK